MPVYKFSHQLLAVLVHLAHTAVKWKTKLLDSWRRRQAGEYGWHSSYEIREEIHAEGCQYHVHGVLVQEGAWQMLPSEVIGYDAAVGVPVTEKIRCTVQLFPSWRKHGRNPRWQSGRIWTVPSSCWVSSEGHWALGWCWIWTHCLTRTCIPDLHGRVPLWHVRLCGSSVSGLQVILAGGTHFCWHLPRKALLA